MNKDLELYLEIVCENEEERKEAISRYKRAKDIINYEKHTLTSKMKKNIYTFFISSGLYILVNFIQNSSVYGELSFIYVVNVLLLMISIFSLFSILDEIENWRTV